MYRCGEPPHIRDQTTDIWRIGRQELQTSTVL